MKVIQPGNPPLQFIGAEFRKIESGVYTCTGYGSGGGGCGAKLDVEVEDFHSSFTNKSCTLFTCPLCGVETDARIENAEAKIRDLSIHLLGESIGNLILSGLCRESEVSRINRLGQEGYKERGDNK